MPPNWQPWDVWSEYTEQTIKLDVLLPNGFFLNLDMPRDASLFEIKADVWEVAQQCPLFGHLSDMDSYLFVCVNLTTAEQEEQIDESRRLCDVKPFHAVLRIVEKKGDKEEKTLNSQIKSLIGKGFHEFDIQNNPEVNEFRKQMRLYCENIASEANVGDLDSLHDKLLKLKPVDIASHDAELPAYLTQKLTDGKLVISIRMEHCGAQTTSKISVLPTTSAQELLDTALDKKYHSTKIPKNRNDFLLKACGLEEYLVGPYLLHQYTYIREMISYSKVPEVCLVSKSDIHIEELRCCTEKSRCRTDVATLNRKKTKQSSTVATWDIDEPVSVILHSVQHLNCDPQSKVAVRLGLYHGNELLCKTICTSEKIVEEGGDVSWDEEPLVFEDLIVSNLPRMGKLCLCIYELSKTAKNNRAKKPLDGRQDTYVNPIAWVNCTVFDFKGVFKKDPSLLHAWPYEDEVDASLNPLGGVVSNPYEDQAAVLNLSFRSSYQHQALIYPSLDKMLNCVSNLQTENGISPIALTQASKSHLEQIRQISDHDSLYQLHEQEKELMWFLRVVCSTQLPHSLPKLLKCVKWNDKRDVVEMTSLLQKWSKIPSVKALELLDYAFADIEVRKFAVNCLRGMTDQEVMLYSLQLVRALKHEAYLNCELVKFLLERAILNRHVGHKIFWLLRSEMAFPDVSIRFGLILEAYCRGAIQHIPSLSKQVEALTKLKSANEIVQIEGNKKKEGKEKLKMLIQQLLSEMNFICTFQDLQSPLDPRYKFQKLRVDKCKFLDSKMKPLWLVFENSDSYGHDVFFIFKNGDDLRQDMLTLQMIRIMDKMWKEEGLDLRMIPYRCLATDHKVGLIEVVPNANTIANIQKEKGFTATSAFEKGSLLSWLKDHNPDEESLSKAAEEFTLSCAGYCVATYVLGIADRHSDNIMVKTNGQLFHIDFGHILGKFKEKFGIKRERVPFVLTHDFVYIITKGHTQKSQEFNRFQQYCERAFVILRRRGSFIISLFAMMLSTGIPELSCEKDLDYLRETLVLDMSEQEAIKHFRSKFDDALRSSWKTSVNWMAHNWAKDNKIE